MVAKGLILSALSFCISLFYGWIILFVIGYKIIRNGTKFFTIKRTTEAPKEAFNPKYGDHSLIALKKQGIRLHYVESGNKNNPLMLMIHGFPDFWYSWRHQIPQFSDKYWVVAVDMRGYGDSVRPHRIKDYKMTNLVADMKELIQALGKDSAIVVAHDWGGVVAWNLAKKEPEIVDKLIILNSPHPDTVAQTIQKSWKQFLMSWYIFFFQLPYLPEFFLTSNNLESLRKIYKEKGNCTDEEFEMYHFTFSQPGALTPPINYYRANFNFLQLPTSKSDSKSSHIKTPTIIIWGDEDIALSTVLADKAAKLCDKADVVKISAGHWVHHERPDLVNKHIHDFLKA